MTTLALAADAPATVPAPQTDQQRLIKAAKYGASWGVAGGLLTGVLIGFFLGRR